MSVRLLIPAALLLVASACARSEDVPEEALEAADTEVAAADVAPVTAAEPAALIPAAPTPATWEASERGEGTTLRLVSKSGDELMALSCANVPREIVAVVSTFTRVANDSRFSLVMGSAPIILVADAASTGGSQGVVARAPVPGNLAAQLSAAQEITATYGIESLGPYAAPDATMVKGLLSACGVASVEQPPAKPSE